MVLPQVSEPCGLVVPISLYQIPGQLHAVLRGYKDGGSAATRRQFSIKAIAVLGHFLNLHRVCIAAAGRTEWEVITTVPSTRYPDQEHKLVTALRMVPGLFETYASLLGAGPAPLGHNIASDDGYVPTSDVAGKRVLLIDDTWTTGARAQSAASALTRAGATVVAIVVLGRVVDPNYDLASRQHWQRQIASPFDFGTCCVH